MVRRTSRPLNLFFLCLSFILDRLRCFSSFLLFCFLQAFALSQIHVSPSSTVQSIPRSSLRLLSLSHQHLLHLHINTQSYTPPFTHAILDTLSQTYIQLTLASSSNLLPLSPFTFQHSNTQQYTPHKGIHTSISPLRNAINPICLFHTPPGPHQRQSVSDPLTQKSTRTVPYPFRAKLWSRKVRSELFTSTLSSSPIHLPIPRQQPNLGSTTATGCYFTRKPL